MILTFVYFCAQTLLRLNLVLDQRPAFLEGLDTMLDGFLWDSGTWFILCLPFLLALHFFKLEKFQSWVPTLTVLLFFVLGCVDYFWAVRIHALGFNLLESAFFILGFTLVTSYATTRISFKLPKGFLKPFIAATAVATLTFVFVVGPWLNNHEDNLQDDQLARNGVYEIAFN